MVEYQFTRFQRALAAGAASILGDMERRADWDASSFWGAIHPVIGSHDIIGRCELWIVRESRRLLGGVTPVSVGCPATRLHGMSPAVRCDPEA